MPGNAYDVFRKSIFPVCRRIFIYAGRGTCAKPHKSRIKAGNSRGVVQAIYSENSSNGLPVARSIQTKRPPCSRTNECGEFSLGSDTEPQFR